MGEASKGDEGKEVSKGDEGGDLEGASGLGEKRSAERRLGIGLGFHCGCPFCLVD